MGTIITRRQMRLIGHMCCRENRSQLRELHFTRLQMERGRLRKPGGKRPRTSPELIRVYEISICHVLHCPYIPTPISSRNF